MSLTRERHKYFNSASEAVAARDAQLKECVSFH
jgi:hypothetical protein